MGLDDISYRTIAIVMDSWELARQKFACEEEVGMQILFKLFKLDPSTKQVFGFKETQDIEGNPMLRMGALIHAASIIRMLDSILALVGPDIETLEVLLAEQGERHTRLGVKASHIPIFGDACRQALSEIIEEGKFTDAMGKAWQDLFSELSAEMLKSMS